MDFSGFRVAPAAGRALASPLLSPEGRSELELLLKERGKSTIETIFDVIDTPASWARDVLAGNELGSRTTPGELLDAHNLRPSEEALGGWGRPIAEFATGALIDPLNMISFGGKTAAGAAARGIRTIDNVNLLDDAARVMSKKLINAGDLDSPYAKNALESWSKNFQKGADRLSDADLRARPLAGARQSQRNLTLRDLVEAQPKASQADLITKVDNQFGQGSYQGLADQGLRSDIGITLPFSDTDLLSVSLPGGEGTARFLDRAGQAIRWSGPARHAHALFDKGLFGATDEAGQVIGKEVSAAIKASDPKARRLVHAATAKLGRDVYENPRLAQSVRNILGGVPGPKDLKLVTPGTPGFRSDIKEFVDSWHGAGGIAEDYLQRRMDMGLPSHPWTSEYDSKYFPRHSNDLSFMEKLDAQLAQKKGGRGGSGRAYDLQTGDMLARKDAFDVPGGERLINKITASKALMTRIKGMSDQKAADTIFNIVNKEARSMFPTGVLPSGLPVPAYSKAKAMKLARVFRQLDPESIAEGMPLFGSHFGDDFSRYVTGNEKSLAITDSIYDLIAGSVKPKKAADVVGGGHMPLSQAARTLGLRNVSLPDGSIVGAKQQLMDRIGRLNGKAVTDLKNYSIDNRVIERLNKVADYYEYPEAHNKLVRTIGRATNVWKGSVLAWPARFVRDWYSGMFSNAVEAGTGTLLTGYGGAKHLIQGDYEALKETLKSLPAYRELAANAPDSALKKFLADLTASGVLGGRRAGDIADARVAMQSGADFANEFLPGQNPRTTVGYQVWDGLTGGTGVGAEHSAYSELGKNWDWQNFKKMGLKRPGDVGNPILRWGQKLGDTTDSINRAAGYIALLAKGIDPLEAADRIRRAHVDYKSLTTFERDYVRMAIPFWSFASRSTKWAAENLANRPGGRFFQFGIRAPQTLLQTGDDEYVPDSVRSKYGMPVSQELATPFGGGTDEATPWLTDIDLPGIDQLNMLDLGRDASGVPDLGSAFWGTMSNAVGGQMNPIGKAAFEQMTGQNLYLKKPLKNFTPAANELAEAWFGISPTSEAGDAIKKVAPYADAVPFVPRVMQVLNRLNDSEKLPDVRDRVYQILVNALTGVKFQNVSEESERIDMRKKIAQMLADDPSIRELVTPYLPKEDQATADPRLLEMLQLDRQLSKESKEARARRAARTAVANPLFP